MIRIHTIQGYSSIKKKKRRTREFLFLSICFMIFLSPQLYAQKKLKSSFAIDTAKTQIFPFDFPFELKLPDSKKAPIKEVYLLRLNNMGKVVFDRHTSFRYVKDNPYFEEIKVLEIAHKRLETIFEHYKNIPDMEKNFPCSEKYKKLIEIENDTTLKNLFSRDKIYSTLKKGNKKFHHILLLKNKIKHLSAYDSILYNCYIKSWQKNIEDHTQDSNKIHKQELKEREEKLLYEEAKLENRNLAFELDKNSTEEQKLELEKVKQRLEKEKLELTKQKKQEIEALKSKIKELKFNVDKYIEHLRFIDALKDIKNYLKDFEREDELASLEIESKEDSVFVKVPALRPNKNYLVLAVDESKKIQKLKELIEDYLINGIAEKKDVVVIPLKYIPEKLIDDIKYHIPAKDFKTEFDKAKKNDISSLLKISKKELKLNNFDFSTKFPGPFEYPPLVSSNDSIRINFPNDFNKDFRDINALLVAFKSYGDDIVKGKYQLEIDSKNGLKINFQPETDLNGLQKSIAKNLHLSMQTQQSLFVLADAKINGYESYEDYFANIVTTLSKNRDIITAKVKVESKLKKILNNMNIPYGLQTKELENTTFTYQFLTRNSRYIKPNFGLLGYFSNKQGFSGIAPYSGVDIAIRPTNEDSNFWKIRRWEKFITFQLGVPAFASQITEEGRRKHLVGDAFSLYTGIGINLGHSFKLGYGPLWFRAVDGNSNGERSYKIKAAHALSIGVNFKLLPLFKNIFGSNKAVNLEQ